MRFFFFVKQFDRGGKFECGWLNESVRVNLEYLKAMGLGLFGRRGGAMAIHHQSIVRNALINYNSLPCRNQRMGLVSLFLLLWDQFHFNWDRFVLFEFERPQTTKLWPWLRCRWVANDRCHLLNRSTTLQQSPAWPEPSRRRW